MKKRPGPKPKHPMKKKRVVSIALSPLAIQRLHIIVEDGSTSAFIERLILNYDIQKFLN